MQNLFEIMGMEYGLFNHTKKTWLHLGKKFDQRFQIDAVSIERFLAYSTYDKVTFEPETKWSSTAELEKDEWYCFGHWYDRKNKNFHGLYLIEYEKCSRHPDEKICCYHKSILWGLIGWGRKDGTRYFTFLQHFFRI